MAEKLKGQVAIVTGAGAGIGRAIAVGLAKEGANLAGVDIQVDKLQETAKEVEALGRKFLAVRCDISKKEDCDNAARETVNEFGKIDILVNNAAIYPVKRFLDITPEEWDAVLAVNLRGAVQMCQAVLPEMVKQRKGSIIMVNSGQSRIPSVVHNHYASSKGALLQLTRCLAAEFGPRGIRVNGFIAGFTPKTEQLEKLLAEGAFPQGFDEVIVKATPLRRVPTPEDYQGIAVFLASDDSAFITGQTISVDGGQTMP